MIPPKAACGKGPIADSHRQVRPTATRKNESWSMDFMSDRLYDGRRLRLLTLVDNHTRESLAIHVVPRIQGRDVARVL